MEHVAAERKHLKSCAWSKSRLQRKAAALKMTRRRFSPHGFSSFAPPQSALLLVLAVVPPLPFFSCRPWAAAPNLQEKECGVRKRRSSLHPFPPSGPCPPTQNLRSLTQGQNREVRPFDFIYIWFFFFFLVDSLLQMFWLGTTAAIVSFLAAIHPKIITHMQTSKFWILMMMRS